MPIFPPIVSNVAVQSIDETTATIIWDTNAPADSFVEWSIAPSFIPTGTTTTDPTLVTSHSMPVTGLMGGLHYIFTAISHNGGGQGSNNVVGNTTATFQNFSIQQVSTDNIVLTCESNALLGTPDTITLNYGPVGNINSSQSGINNGATSGGFYQYEFDFTFNTSPIEFNVFLNSDGGSGYTGFTSDNQIMNVPAVPLPPPPPDPIIQGIVRRAPNWQLNPEFMQQDITAYVQRDKEYLSTDIFGEPFR